MAKLSATECDKAIGKKIQARRKEWNLTAFELSEKIGISQQQLSRYERGDNKINISHLIDIAQALNTPLNWFLLDCLADTPQRNADDLKERLEFHWQQFDEQQKQAVITFLDSVHLVK